MQTGTGKRALRIFHPDRLAIQAIALIAAIMVITLIVGGIMTGGPLYGIPADPRRAAAQPLAYRQGTIIAWNATTTENQVQVGGAVLTNLPLLNSTEAYILAPGDVVGIISTGEGYAILGRLVIPGSAAAASALLASRIGYDMRESSDNTTSTTYGDLFDGPSPVVEILVGNSGRCIVSLGAYLSLFPPAPGGRMGVQLSGANTIAPGQPGQFLYAYRVGGWTSDTELMYGITFLITGLTPGLTTFTAKYLSMSAVNAMWFGHRSLLVQCL